jgi:hypothetical protein
MRYLSIFLIILTYSCNQNPENSDGNTATVKESYTITDVENDIKRFKNIEAQRLNSDHNIYSTDQVLIDFKESYDDDFNQVLKLTVTNPFKKNIKSILIIDSPGAGISHQEIVLKGSLKPGQKKVHTVPGTTKYRFPLHAILVKFTDGSQEYANDPRDYLEWKVTKEVPY